MKKFLFSVTTWQWIYIAAIILLFAAMVQPAFGADVPSIKTAAWSVDIIGTNQTAADVPFDLVNHDTCGVQSLIRTVPASGVVFVESAGNDLGCGVPIAILHLPDTVKWLARFTYREGGIIRSSFVTPPLGAATNGHPATLAPIINQPGTSLYITTFPPVTLFGTDVSLLWSDGTVETWTAQGPYSQHASSHQGVGTATLMIGAPGSGPFPDATVPCLATMDDGTTSNTIVVPCK